MSTSLKQTTTPRHFPTRSNPSKFALAIACVSGSISSLCPPPLNPYATRTYNFLLTFLKKNWVAKNAQNRFYSKNFKKFSKKNLCQARHKSVKSCVPKGLAEQTRRDGENEYEQD
ncbi:MAG: hypothetical protein LBC87_04185 [Fibromonadaceae bacterium]|nr:hypothetical protein [Fibromonadaceae bacterium]